MRMHDAARVVREVHYPESDGKPMAETDRHRKILTGTIEVLGDHFAGRPKVYVGGNLLIYYQRGKPRKSIASDVFVVKRSKGKHDRRTWLLWEEGAGPDAVFEITSKSTKKEDVVTKMALYRDVLKVKEYFLFDPFEEYLDPSMQGWRLRGGLYMPIKTLEGRLPSRVLGLHLERSGADLRFYDPRSKKWLPTREEIIRQTQAEIERLQREIEELRRRPDGRP